MKVHTIFGLIDREDLEVTDIVTWGDNDRAIATEWKLKRDLMGTIDEKTGFLQFVYDNGNTVESRKGALARRDVAVSVLRPQLVGVEQTHLQ